MYGKARSSILDILSGDENVLCIWGHTCQSAFSFFFSSFRVLVFFLGTERRGELFLRLQHTLWNIFSYLFASPFF